MINKDKIKRRFSRNAKTYDQYAIVQKHMGDFLINQLKDTQPKSILEIGSGTGYVTKKLSETFPNADILAVDIAEGMIKVAQASIEKDHVTFICEDIESYDLTDTYDLIISNATFQWFNTPLETLNKLKSCLNSNGQLIFSTFGNETFKELHATYSKLQDNCVSSVQPGQSFMTEKAMYNMLHKVFNHVSVTSEFYTEYFDSCLDFFQSIKKIGANNASAQSTVKDPNFIHRVIEAYEADYHINNQIFATYHALFGIISD